MRLVSVEPKNYRCFAQRTFMFAQQFNLIVGDNASGKSAALEASSIALSEFLRGISPEHANIIRNDDVRYNSYLLGQSVTLEQQFPSSITCTVTLNEQTVRSCHEKNTLGETSETSWGTLVGAANKLRQEVGAKSDAILPVVAFYRTARHWPQSRKQVNTVGPRSRITGYDDCLASRIGAGRFTEWLKTRELESLQRSARLELLEAVRAAMCAGIENAEDIRFDIGLDEIVIKFADESTPFHSLSDGYRNMLSMVGDIAYRAAVLNPQLLDKAAQLTSGVVLIDEIDLHLHPIWQRRVVGDLMQAFPKIQFIATTHSPFIIQSLPDSPTVQLINLDDSDDNDFAGKSIEDIAETVQGIPDVQRSERHIEMMRTAKEYYRLLRENQASENGRREQLKRRLDELVQPFSDDPAYLAFLEMKRVASGIEKTP